MTTEQIAELKALRTHDADTCDSGCFTCRSIVLRFMECADELIAAAERPLTVGHALLHETSLSLDIERERNAALAAEEEKP